MNKKTACGALVMALAANSAAAHIPEWFELKPYVGADAQVRRMDFKGGFGDNLFQHHSPQGNVYAGLKLNSRVGIEFGYESTTTRIRAVTLGTGDLASGAPVSASASPVVFKSKAKIKGPHADLVGFYSFYEDSPLQLMASMGASFFKGTFERRTLQANGIPKSTVRTLSRHKILLRLGGGLQYMLDEHFGLRANIGWVGTGKMVLLVKDGLMPNAPTPELKPKNSTVYGLGGLWVF